MNMTPDKLKELIAILGIYPLILIIQASFKGTLYDDSRHKIDSNYKGNHTFSFKRGKIFFAIPFPILTNIENETVKEYKSNYNKIAYRFWIILILLIIAYNII